MRLLVAAALVLVAGCTAIAADREDTQAVPQAAGVDGGVMLPECNGTNMRHICESYPATAGSRYGMLPTCTGTPFLPTDADGGVASRDAGLAGCTPVGYPTYDGKPYAICCP